MLEAMGMGKSVIAPNAEGIKEVVDNKINGMLVDSNSARELGEAINRLVSDNEFSKRLGESARRTIAEKYSEEVIACKIINVQ